MRKAVRGSEESHRKTLETSYLLARTIPCVQKKNARQCIHEVDTRSPSIQCAHDSQVWLNSDTLLLYRRSRISLCSLD